MNEVDTDMIFDKEHKVIIGSMNKTEACAFVKFLQSEIERHKIDIQQAVSLISTVRSKFKL